jgi:truncated hemoglobin YjbI
MIRNYMSRWGILLGLGVLVVGFGTIAAADDPKPGSAAAEHARLDQQIADTLRDVHNKGAELYNNGDRNGCYRMFQGALLTVKPLLALHPDLQKEIEEGLVAADKQPRVDNQAFELHKLIEGVRGKLKTSAAAAKPAETKTGTASKGGSKTTEAGKTEPKKSEVTKTAPGKSATRTLWDRLGGEANVKKIVDDFFALVAADPKVNATRGGKFKLDEAKAADLKAKTVDIISEGTGGPRKYTGKSLKEVHAGMGITDDEFKAAGDDLVAALKKNGVAQADIDEVVKIFADMRKVIVEPKKPEEKKPGGDATVRGKITFNGKPLALGTISFHWADGTIASTEVNKEGEYVFARLSPGTCKVTVTSKDAPAKYEDVNTSGLTCEVKSGRQSFDIALK